MSASLVSRSIAATGVAPQFAAGAWFVGLAGASDGRDIDEIVAAAIGPLVADRQRLRARIAEAIGGRQMLLLVVMTGDVVLGGVV